MSHSFLTLRRGNLVAPTPVVVNPKTYVADHDTEPPGPKSFPKITLSLDKHGIYTAWSAFTLVVQIHRMALTIDESVSACPVGQEIRSDPENILIRTLLMRKEKLLGSKGKQDKGKPSDKGKRPAEAAADTADAKRVHASGSGKSCLGS